MSHVPSAMPSVREPAKLPRTLGLWSSVALVVGITIGSGIFRSSAGIAQKVPSPLLMIGLWVLGGAITLCGALSLAEVAAALPETGGIYAFIREGWGRQPAFLFGWSELVLIRASALGGIAVVFGEYLLRSFGVDPVEHVIGARALSAAAIAFAALANIRGAKVGAAIVGVATWMKFSALALLVLAAFALGSGHGAAISHLTTGTGSPIGVGAMGLAVVSILWAYDGWADLSFASGEVKEPHVNLPRAIILGTVAIIALYVLTNIAYLYVSPVEAVAKSPLVAADTMFALFGRVGVALVSMFVMISSFSSLNGSMLASPRVFFAMADDGLLFNAIAKVHPRYKTPYVAILVAALLGMALVMSRSFERLTDTFVIAIWPFYALAVAAVYTLRRSRPDLARPYRAIGYPVVPALFILAVAAFVINSFVNDTVNTVITFALIAIGIPIYYAFFS
ncbi:MAG TPA: amino acid permease [Vicinamibacterales bacterium]|nr:amino acid permease [Vicinamibacterales bacterium]